MRDSKRNVPNDDLDGVCSVHGLADELARNHAELDGSLHTGRLNGRPLLITAVIVVCRMNIAVGDGRTGLSQSNSLQSMLVMQKHTYSNTACHLAFLRTTI